RAETATRSTTSTRSTRGFATISGDAISKRSQPPLRPHPIDRQPLRSGPRPLARLFIPSSPTEVFVDRREFLAATAVAAVAPKPKLDKLDALAQAANRQFIELRRYQLLPGTRQRAFGTYLAEAA